MCQGTYQPSTKVYTSNLLATPIEASRTRGRASLASVFVVSVEVCSGEEPGTYGAAVARVAAQSATAAFEKNMATMNRDGRILRTLGAHNVDNSGE